VLPIPFALSKTGLLVGCLVMLVVAAANDATSCYLIRAAAATGKPTYEALAEWAGGKPWKVGTAQQRQQRPLDLLSLHLRAFPSGMEHHCSREPQHDCQGQAIPKQSAAEVLECCSFLPTPADLRLQHRHLCNSRIVPCCGALRPPHPAPALQVFTQITLVLLLWGTMCGGLALISDVAVIMVDKGWAHGQPVPPWINGRTCMATVAVLVLFPLCLQRHMREVGARAAQASPAQVASPTHVAYHLQCCRA
jgi:hypothetical protein